MTMPRSIPAIPRRIVTANASGVIECRSDDYGFENPSAKQTHERPRILYVTRVWSMQPTSAGELRAWHVARALQQIASLKIVVLDDEDANEHAAAADVAANVALRVGVRLCPNVGWAQKVNWLVNPRSPTPHGIGVNQADLQRVREMAGQFDAVWFFELRTANMFPWWKWPRSVVDISDVPSTFEQSAVAAERVRHKRVTGRLRLWSWQRRERLLKERFSVLTVCS